METNDNKTMGNMWTVVPHFVATERSSVDGNKKESEALLEEMLIARLKENGYEYIEVKSEKELVANLRKQLEQLNDIRFSEGEWKRLFEKEIARVDASIEDKTEIIQRNNIVSLELDSGDRKNIRLIEVDDVMKNSVQVINQYEVNEGLHKNRYDVTILVNGLPLVHVELKRRGGSIKEAFNQIDRYQRESFWAGSGLFEYVQLFVISCGTETKYYSNTTRFAHVKRQERQKYSLNRLDGDSFEFTIYWSDQQNNKVVDLVDFCETFFQKHTLLNILTRYCVFTVDKKLLVMRPYQITATEKILAQIRKAIKYDRMGLPGAGGYVWHTTGSGKTLTSFKTAQLIKDRIPEVEKVLFVVDRQDLDYQTMREYDNFEKGCANGNRNSSILLKQLNDVDAAKKIIITTIQKLNSLLSKKETQIKVLDKPVVMIFDECHRSQFGEMHDRIVQKFKKYIMFGFTGTPIFAKNATSSSSKLMKTTAQVFCDMDENGKAEEEEREDVKSMALHCYTIVDAVDDCTVLPFLVDYMQWGYVKEDVKDKPVKAIDTKKVMSEEKRRGLIVKDILENYDKKTKQNSRYGINRVDNVSEMAKDREHTEEKHRKVSVYGFNGMFAVESVKMAIMYYEEFKRQQDELGKPMNQRLKVATIFSYQANEDGEEDNSSADGLTTTEKEGLVSAIKDYNGMFGTNYAIDGDGFQNYYKDVSLRMKNKEIDLLIVVGMFLTGFDAKTLNTLWVDKNMKMHGLLQAFSRTNRIFNSVKDCGNIVCYRNLKERVDESIALFGDKDASGKVLYGDFDEYFELYKGLLNQLRNDFKLSQMAELSGSKAKGDFVKLFGQVLRMQNKLEGFTEYWDKKHEGEIMKKEGVEFNDYMTWYNNYHEEYKQKVRNNAEDVTEDVVFEMELVEQVQINVDYILEMVQKYHESNVADKRIEIKQTITRLIGASPSLRSKRDLLLKFMDKMSASNDNIRVQWKAYMDEARRTEFKKIVDEEHLKEKESVEYIMKAFKYGYVKDTGLELANLLPPLGVFGGVREAAKKRVLEKFRLFVDKYIDEVEIA